MKQIPAPKPARADKQPKLKLPSRKRHDKGPGNHFRVAGGNRGVSK